MTDEPTTGPSTAPSTGDESTIGRPLSGPPMGAPNQAVTSARAAGWRPDPYGRGQFRYYDGERWTASIATDGVPTTDPLGVTASIPFTLPTALSAPPTAAAAAGEPAGTPGPAAREGSGPDSTPEPHATSAPPAGLLASMGTRATARPAPTLRGSFGAVGGVILTSGLLVLVLANDVVSATTGAVVGAVLVIGSAFAMSRTRPADFDFRAACIAMAAIGILTFASALTSGDGGTATFLIAGVLMMVGWIAPPFRGTPLFLGGGTLAIVVGLAIAIGESAGSSRFGGGSTDGDSIGGMLPFDGFLPQTRSAGIFLLVATVVLAIIVRRVDARSHHGISAPLLVAAMFSAVFGIAASGAAFDDSATYAIAAIAGAMLAFVGARGGHRATTWLGAILAAAGTIAAVLSGATPSSARAGGAIALFVGAALIVGPRLVALVAGDDDAETDRPANGVGTDDPELSGGSVARP